MAVTEFLDAVDKKKKAEEAAMAAAPVSAEVAPATPSMFGTPAPMESVVDTVGRVEVQSPFSQAAAPNPMAAAVDPMAQPDALAAAPAVQAPPSLVTDNPFAPSVGVSEPTVPQDVQDATERARIEDRLARTNAGIIASGETIPSLGVAAPQEFKPVGGGFSFGGDTPIPADRESGFIPEKEEFLTGGTPVFSNQGRVPAPTPEATPAVEAETPVPVADLSVNGTDVATPEAITEAGQAAVAPQDRRAGSGGLISFDSGARSGQTFFADESGVRAVTPEVAQNITAGFDEKYGTRSNGDIRITDAQGQYVDPNRDMYSPEFRTPEMQANIDAGRPPNVSASDVQEAQEQAVQNKEDYQRILDQRRRDAAQKRIDKGMRSFMRENRNATPEQKQQQQALLIAQENELEGSAKVNDLSVSEQIAVSGENRALRAEKREAEEAKLADTQSYNNALAAARSLVRDVGNIEDVAGTAKVQADSALTTGPGGLVMSILPGSKASDLRASLDTLTADSAFSALSEMRASSKTGGALGAISERELTLLGAAKRSLSANQSDEQLIKNIDTYIKLRNRMMADAKLRFAQDYGVERANEAFGGGQGGASSAIPNDRNVPSDPMTEANIAKYNV